MIMIYRRIKNSDFIITEEPDDIDVFKVIANVFPYGTIGSINNWYTNRSAFEKKIMNALFGDDTKSLSIFTDWITYMVTKRQNISISDYLFGLIDTYGISRQVVKGGVPPEYFGYTLSVEGVNQMCNYLFNKYGDKWDKLINTNNLTQENVLNPLDIVHNETEANQLDKDGDDNDISKDKE